MNVFRPYYEPRPFYVRRLACWGGVDRFIVADCRTREAIGNAHDSRRVIEKRAERMNDDFDRFVRAIGSPYYTGGARPGNRAGNRAGAA